MVTMIDQYVTSTKGITEDYFNGSTPHDQLSSVRQQDKPMFTRKSILDFLELRKGEGATISDIVDATGFDRHTISNHLAYLGASRQVYTTTGHVYHKNGRVLHYKNMQNRIFDKRFYTFYWLQQNFEDDYVYIQEKEVGKLKSVTVKGGIMINLIDFQKFVSELTNFSNEVVEKQNESKT